MDVAKRKCERGHSLSRSAPGDNSRGGVVLMVTFVLRHHNSSGGLLNIIHISSCYGSIKVKPYP